MFINFGLNLCICIHKYIYTMTNKFITRLHAFRHTVYIRSNQPVMRLKKAKLLMTARVYNINFRYH